MLAKIFLIIAAMLLVVAYEFGFISVTRRGGDILLGMVYFCLLSLAALLSSAI